MSNTKLQPSNSEIIPEVLLVVSETDKVVSLNYDVTSTVESVLVMEKFGNLLKIM